MAHLFYREDKRFKLLTLLTGAPLFLATFLSCFSLRAGTLGEPVLVRDSAYSSLPSFFKDVCSGASLKIQDGRTIFCTANHCIKNWGKNHSLEAYPNAWSTLSGVIFSSKSPIEISISSVESHPDQDIACTQIRSQEIQAFDVSFNRPLPRESISFWGYPNGRGPKRIYCQYAGSSLIFNPVNHALVIMEKGICPKIGLGMAMEGASGAPILNSAGSAIGIQSGYYYGKNETVITFQALEGFEIFNHSSTLLNFKYSGKDFSGIQAVDIASNDKRILSGNYNNEGRLTILQTTFSDGHIGVVKFSQPGIQGTSYLLDKAGQLLLDGTFDNGKFQPINKKR